MSPAHFLTNLAAKEETLSVSQVCPAVTMLAVASLLHGGGGSATKAGGGGGSATKRTTGNHCVGKMRLGTSSLRFCSLTAVLTPRVATWLGPSSLRFCSLTAVLTPRVATWPQSVTTCSDACTCTGSSTGSSSGSSSGLSVGHTALLAVSGVATPSAWATSASTSATARSIHPATTMVEYHDSSTSAKFQYAVCWRI